VAPDCEIVCFISRNPKHSVVSSLLPGSTTPTLFSRHPCAVGAIGGAAGGALVLVGAGVAAALLYRKKKRQAELRKRSGKLATADVPSLHSIDAAAPEAPAASKLAGAGDASKKSYGPVRTASRTPLKWGMHSASTRYLMRASSRVHAAPAADGDASVMQAAEAAAESASGDPGAAAAAANRTDSTNSAPTTSAASPDPCTATDPAPETARPLQDSDLTDVQPSQDCTTWADRTAMGAIAAASAESTAGVESAAVGAAAADVEGATCNPLLRAEPSEALRPTAAHPHAATPDAAAPAAATAAPVVVKPDLSALRPPSKSRLRLTSPGSAAATTVARRAAGVQLLRSAATAASAAAYMSAQAKAASATTVPDAAATGAEGGGASQHGTRGTSGSKPHAERGARAASGWSRRNLLTARLEAEGASSAVADGSGGVIAPAATAGGSTTPESEADLLLRELSSADLLADMRTARPAGARVPLEAIPEGDAPEPAAAGTAPVMESAVLPPKPAVTSPLAPRTKSTLRLTSLVSPRMAAAASEATSPTLAAGRGGADTLTAEADRGFAAASSGAAAPPRLQSSNRHISMRALVTDAAELQASSAPLQAAAAGSAALPVLAATPRESVLAAAVEAAPPAAKAAPPAAEAAPPAAEAAPPAALSPSDRLARTRSTRSTLRLVAPSAATSAAPR